MFVKLYYISSKHFFSLKNIQIADFLSQILLSVGLYFLCDLMNQPKMLLSSLFWGLKRTFFSSVQNVWVNILVMNTGGLEPEKPVLESELYPFLPIQYWEVGLLPQNSSYSFYKIGNNNPCSTYATKSREWEKFEISICTLETYVFVFFLSNQLTSHLFELFLCKRALILASKCTISVIGILNLKQEL